MCKTHHHDEPDSLQDNSEDALEVDHPDAQDDEDALGTGRGKPQAAPQDNLEDELQTLMARACSFPPRSFERRRALSRMVFLVSQSRKLWRESTPYYEDVLQKIWLYVCQNPEIYDPERGQVITWINYYLKQRLKDERIRIAKDRQRRIPNSPQTEIDPVDNLPASTDIPPILEDVLRWILTDPDGDLLGTCMQCCPEINCQMLLLHRFPLPPPTRWKDIAQQHQLPLASPSMFYTRKCWPKLRDFGQKQGYL